jgi:lipopolysaccharide export LptBFGC system permease protein LptF
MVHRFGEWKLQAREVNASGDRMRGVTAWSPSVGETIFAERGTLQNSVEGGSQLVLSNGSVIVDPRTKPREIRFDQMHTHLPSGDEPITRDAREQLSGASLNQLKRFWRRGKIGSKKASAARIELHRRFALPSVTLIFGVLALPLFLSRSHFSRSGGGVLGVMAIVVYYGLVQLGNGLIQAELLNEPAGVWMPNLIIGAIALILFVRLTRVSAFGRHLARPPAGELRPLARLRGRAARVGPGGSAVAEAPEGETATAGAPPVERRIRVHRWALQRYISGRFLQMVAICFSVSLVAYLLVDVLERLQWFARYDATGVEVIRFYAARIPLLASRVIPMALLVATALTVGLLAVQGELVGIRACGIPAPRALIPVLVICALIAPGSFLLNNNVVPRTNALADYLKQTEIKGSSEPDSEESHAARGRARSKAIWYRAGQRFYEAVRLDPQLGTAREITVYELGPDGLPLSRTDARGARHFGGGVWRLIDSLRVEVSEEGLREVPAVPFAELGEEVPAEVDTMHLSVGDLRREIVDLRENSS